MQNYNSRSLTNIVSSYIIDPKSLNFTEINCSELSCNGYTPMLYDKNIAILTKK